MIYALIAVGLIAIGEGIYIGASAKGGKSEQVTQVDIATDAPETVEAAGEAANAERLAELDVSRALAEAPASSIACRAAVEDAAEPVDVALCALLACWSHVEGAETSAGLGCQQRGTTLDGLLQPQTE